MVNLKGRSFLTLKDYSKEEIRYLLDLAHQLKKAKKAGRIGKTLEGKNIVLLFEKTSTRTRCAFEVAALDEAALPNFSIGLFLPILIRNWALAEVTARNATSAMNRYFFIS